MERMCLGPWRHEPPYRKRLRAAILLLWLSWVGPACAQIVSGDGVTSFLGPPAGAQRYRPGVWGLVEVTAVNETDGVAETTSVLRFVDDPTLQYGRQLLVPPRSILHSTCPILIPEFVSPTTSHVDFLTLQIEPPPGESVTNRSAQDVRLGAKSLNLDHEPSAMGLIGDFHYAQPPGGPVPFYTGTPRALSPADQEVYELALAARRFRDLSRRVSVLDPEYLPPGPGCLDVLDVLILSTDRIGSDPGAVATVRDWVLNGGHLWILLDEVQPTTVATIMGDAFATEVVDRVELTQVQLHNTRTDLAYADEEELTFEQPIPFVRVLPHGVTVTDTIDGWPAAFQQPFGAGQVFFTTVGPRAWMRPTTADDPPPRVPGHETPFVARGPLQCFVLECFAPRARSPLDTQSLQPILTQQIGYRILSRATVTVILTIFCLALAAGGWWFFRTGHPERLLWAVPVAAGLVSLVFVAIGMTTKRAVPPTVATIAHVVFQPGVNAAHASGLAAVYNQQISREPMGATRGGLFFPDMTSLTGRHRRVVWTDEIAWHWAELQLPSGVRTAPFEFPMPLDQLVDCQAQFGPRGLEGSLGPLPFSHLEDAIIVQPHSAAMAVHTNDNGTFATSSSDVLPSGVFVAQSWLDDTQRRRQAVYQRLFESPTGMEDATAPPQLYAWTEACEMGFTFPQTHQLGSTLLSLAVRITKTPPGTQVTVPPPFVSYRAVPGPDGSPPTAYANLMHRWIESMPGATDRIRFQIPHTVLPLKIARATLSLSVRAASRSLKILAFQQDQPVVVLALSRPIGSYSVVLDRSELLQLDPDGGLLLMVQVSDDEASDTDDRMGQSPWQIESLQLEVTGTVLP